MEWYKSLNIEQKINLKDCCNLIVGITWKEMSLFFSFRERVEVLYSKLKLEGFEV